jgi:hypothetical protein
MGFKVRLKEGDVVMERKFDEANNYNAEPEWVYLYKEAGDDRETVAILRSAHVISIERIDSVVTPRPPRATPRRLAPPASGTRGDPPGSSARTHP